jgi:protein O-GlcNAc transferase
VDQAIAPYRKTLALNPDFPEALSILANLLFTKGPYGPAADSYHEGIRIRPEYAQAHYNLANTTPPRKKNSTRPTASIPISALSNEIQKRQA